MNEIQIRRKVKEFIKDVTTLDMCTPSEMAIVLGLIPVCKLPKENAKEIYDWYMKNK